MKWSAKPIKADTQKANHPYAPMLVVVLRLEVQTLLQARCGAA